MLLCNAENDHIGPLTVALAETFAPGTTPLGLTPLIDDAPRLTELAHDIVARLRPWDPSLFTPELRGLIEKFGDEAIDWLGPTGPVIGPFVLVPPTGRASGRERVGQYVDSSVVAESF